jgi:hypothetical protein
LGVIVVVEGGGWTLKAVGVDGQLDIEGGWWRCPDLMVGGGVVRAELRRRWRRSRGGVK